MKTNIFYCFLFFSIISFGKEDREIIKQIDNINSVALKSFNDKDIVKSFKEFINAKKLSDSIEDNYGSATANFNLGNIYNLMENYKSAEEHYQLTLKSLKNIDDNYLLASTYLNLAAIQIEKGDDTRAIAYFEKSLKYSSINSHLITSDKQQLQSVYFDASISLCELYIENNNLEEALMSLLKIKEHLKKNNFDSHSEGYFKYVYGIYYVRKELYNNASSKFREAIILLENEAEELDFMLLSKIYMQLSISQAKSGHSIEAYLTLLEQNSYKDKVLNENKHSQDFITKSKFLIEDYKNNAERANAEKLEQIEIANKFKKINMVIFITLMLLIVSVIIICISYFSKIKLSKTLEVKNTELEKAKNEALKSSELKSKFISNVTHELRTPLYGVVGITSLLLDKNNLDSSDRKYLKSLKYSGDYLLSLINDILQVGKMESNKIELKNVSVNLRESLKDIVNTFDYRLVETNNKISIAIDNNVPEYIKCDKVMLSQILINLIGNSVKFTNNGTINLKVNALNSNDKNVDLRFEVEDSGIGIPKDKFQTIFDNFSQLEDSNLNYQGTGLGLSITKNLIGLFNSEINLESEVGVGTKISFDINFEIVEIETKVSPNKESLINDVDTTTKPEYRILVAEDNKINQIVTKNLLKKHGYSCTIVENGKEALDEVRQSHYDLVLMDINMPIMGGNEATKAIRTFNNKLPIIALTAADIDEVAENCKNSGYNDLIIKPFDNYDFFQVITANIQNSDIDKGIRFVKAS
jgi:signal transduction histidine kinase/ActR/RegA family two-component response regulator